MTGFIQSVFDILVQGEINFYVRSGTDQISVLFRRGPLFVYAVLRKIRKFIPTADKLTTSMLARKCDARRHIMTSLTPV